MRLAVVGCGAAAEWYHLPAVERVAGRDGVWLVDPDLGRARSLARRFGSRRRVARDHRAVIGKVDAAIVAAPNRLHASIAIDLLRGGIDVLVEKPLAPTPAEARAIVAAAEGRVLAAGHFRRLFPSTARVARILASGELGAVVRVDAEEGFVYGWGARGGLADVGGVLLDIGPHVLDELRLWVGDLNVVGYRDDAHGGREADCVVELDCGSVELSRTRRLRNTARIECAHGSIEAPLASPGPVVVVHADGTQATYEDGGDYAAAFEAQLRAFLYGSPAATGEDGVAAVELLERCRRLRRPIAEPWTTETLVRR